MWDQLQASTQCGRGGRTTLMNACVVNTLDLLSLGFGANGHLLKLHRQGLVSGSHAFYVWQTWSVSVKICISVWRPRALMIELGLHWHYAKRGGGEYPSLFAVWDLLRSPKWVSLNSHCGNLVACFAIERFCQFCYSYFPGTKNYASPPLPGWEYIVVHENHWKISINMYGWLIEDDILKARKAVLVFRNVPPLLWPIPGGA